MRSTATPPTPRQRSAASGGSTSTATGSDARSPGWSTKRLRPRDELLWGTGTACTSDSKQFGSWESNLMTEWHARYGGPGVMVYWHVERKQLCIYSQLTTCSASEVAAMLQGLLTATTVSTINSHPWWTDKRGPVIPSARVAVVGSSRRGFRPRRGPPQSIRGVVPR